MTAAKSGRPQLPQRDIVYSSRFPRDVAAMREHNVKQSELDKVLELLVNRRPVPAGYKDHRLLNHKKWNGCRELHIRENWLLVYYCKENGLNLVAMGTHGALEIVK